MAECLWAFCHVGFFAREETGDVLSPFVPVSLGAITAAGVRSVAANVAWVENCTHPVRDW